MKNKEPKDMTCKKMAWTVRNFSTLTFNIRYYSEVFTANHCAWRLFIYRGEIDNDMSLTIGLESADALSLPQGCNIWAAYKLTVVDQISRKNSRTHGDADKPYKFCANSTWWNYRRFMPLSELQKPYIQNDTCMIEVEFFSVTFEGFEPPSHPKDDFKDLGKIEKSFIPLLEEVCSWHPSLLDCTKNKSRRFTKWALTTLGQVLQFLKNKKWKDMNEEACEQLQHLWEELEMSRVDLSWLEPLVKSALNMKGYDEKIEKVKKLKQNLVVAETEMNMIKEKLAHAEQNVEKTRKELVNVEEDFEEKDLEAKIGYG
ncbi:hypothetical protein QN277_028761 [Acacia crassicarpa]|uniref:MATH domain-containing protein n=1 Tax=Acacia crassicarpa TaxID=499986 RepID=A0AAE1MFH9_9FABA|nr:hypothetical protein QN277_028761 [Acacia crassicarpa]